MFLHVIGGTFLLVYTLEYLCDTLTLHERSFQVDSFVMSKTKSNFCRKTIQGLSVLSVWIVNKTLLK